MAAQSPALPVGRPALLWMDFEMTGLDERVDRIVEVAARITDYDFNTLEDYHAIVNCEQSALDQMNDFVRAMHTKSGLINEIPSGKPIAECERELMALVAKHFGSAQPILSGNSIHVDRRFIRVELPAFHALCHYRLLDVSAWKIIFENKFNLRFPKAGKHRAIDDISESISELQHYLKYVDVKLNADSLQ